MLKTQKRSQAEIFQDYGWWDRSCMLFQINKERCDYIESCIERVFGRESLRQQEVLEIGCGGGLIVGELAQRKAIVFGIDPSAGALAEARRHLQAMQLGHNTHFYQAYAEHLPYADGSFSVIVCMDVLEHVGDLSATVREIARVLAPGGVFVFDTINRTLIARIVLLWLGEGLLGRLFPRMGLVPGLHRYEAFIKPEELQATITEAGLQVQELRGFMPYGLKRGGLKLGLGPFKGISYVGYATKNR
jgi:2-polyprenyl-6-hydroxyphenyl methylase/3-demethylubiquinone-9 3-methyltransferase